MPPPNNKFRFRGLAGNAATLNPAFLNSLANAGPLAIRDDHMLASLLTNLPPITGGGKIFDLRRVFFCVVANMQLANDVLDLHAAWFPLPLELARIFYALDAAGMPMTAVADEEALRGLIARWMPKLSAARVSIDTAIARWVCILYSKYIISKSSG